MSLSSNLLHGNTLYQDVSWQPLPLVETQELLLLQLLTPIARIENIHANIEPCNILTLVLLNKLRSHAHFWFSANQITWFWILIQIHILNDKQCRSRSVGFFRSPTDLDLHCLQRQGISGFSRTRVKQSTYSEPSKQRQHLFTKLLPLKWICRCNESLMSKMICKKGFVLFLFLHWMYAFDISWRTGTRGHWAIVTISTR